MYLDKMLPPLLLLLTFQIILLSQYLSHYSLEIVGIVNTSKFMLMTNKLKTKTFGMEMQMIMFVVPVGMNNGHMNKSMFHTLVTVSLSNFHQLLTNHQMTKIGDSVISNLPISLIMIVEIIYQVILVGLMY